MDEEATPTTPDLLRILKEVMRYALYLPRDVKERARDAIEKAKETP